MKRSTDIYKKKLIESQKFLKEKRLEKPKLKDMKTSKCTESCSCMIKLFSLQPWL